MISDEQVEVLRNREVPRYTQEFQDALSAALDTIEKLPRTADGYRVGPSTHSDAGGYHSSTLVAIEADDGVFDGVVEMRVRQVGGRDHSTHVSVLDCLAARAALESEADSE